MAAVREAGPETTVAVRIAVLGELSVVRDGTPVPITGPGRRALLALLASNVGRPVPIELIIGALWGDDPPATALKVVQTYVSQLRKLVEPDHGNDWQVLLTHPSGYELRVEPRAVDAARFEAAARDTAELAAVDAVEPLRDALSLWRGRPYAGIDLPFASEEARRLERVRAAVLSHCLAGELARGRHREVEPELRALVAERPFDESLAELLMLALYRGGRQAEALHVFAELQRRLAEELGADPGPSIARLHERILRHDPGLHPGAEVTESATGPSRGGRDVGNLPSERSSFVGRRAEVAEVVATVCRHRLTTLVGAGGAGKTRLALRAAANAVDEFDGVWLVDLATLEDPGQLDGHCLARLGIRDQMDRAPGDTLRAWVGDRHLLLVLDNCEHLVTAVADLTDRLLSACPDLHVLATSRRPLRCPGERQWRVPTLRVPTAGDVPTVGESEAGSLFAARAGDARPDFRLDETTAPAVFQICRRLDGIPLAIELAAVRMATMSAADLAARLDDRFRLLTSGNRTALPRHRTLLATTEWSYDLLSPRHQRLLCRLSAFVADFDAEMAADVCGFPPLDPRDVAGLLADLADHSLVETWEVDGHGRYGILETVREYGQERLGDDAEPLARGYGEWVARLMESVGANAHRDTAAWYGRLEQEFPHVQGAFAAAMRRGDAETALRIAVGSGWALIITGRYHRLREWVRQAMALARRVDLDGRVMAQGALMAGAVAGIDHRFDGTLELLEEARQRFTAAGDAAGTLWAGYWRAATLAEMGQLGRALQQIRETARAAADHGLDVVECNARAEQAELLVAASLEQNGPDGAALEDAGAALTRARQLAELHGMQELLARVGLSEALLIALEGDPVAALTPCLEQVDAWRRLGHGNRLLVGLVATAKVALLAKRPAQARLLVREAMRLIGEFAWSAPLRAAVEVLVVLSAERDPGTAAKLLGAAEARPPTHRWRMPTDLTQVRTFLCTTLGPDAFSANHAAGERLTIDEIVTLAEAVTTRPSTLESAHVAARERP